MKDLFFQIINTHLHLKDITTWQTENEFTSPFVILSDKKGCEVYNLYNGLIAVVQMYVWYISGCHIARLTARERCICRSRRNNSKISGVDTSYLRALRALSTPSKDEKSDKTTDTNSDERDSGSKLVDDARLSTGTETERMIRSIAEAVGDTGPMDHIEKLDKLDKALSKLVQYFLCNA